MVTKTDTRFLELLPSSDGVQNEEQSSCPSFQQPVRVSRVISASVRNKNGGRDLYIHHCNMNESNRIVLLRMKILKWRNVEKAICSLLKEKENEVHTFER